jgi:hypothetical protein
MVSHDMGGHPIVEQATPVSTENPTPASARRNDGASPGFTSGDRIAVPPNAVELLRESINAQKDGPAFEEKIRNAAVLICGEAHRLDAMPEQLVVSLKELCHSLPEYERIPGARERDAFLSAVVTLAIEEYYRS